MFRGSIPEQMRSIVLEHALAWRGAKDIWVGCSGNFTIERTLANHGCRLHGNDVTIYSCIIGRFLAGLPVRLRIREAYKERYGWLEPYLVTPASTVATLQLSTAFLKGLKRSNPYYERLQRAYKQQWSELHSKTLKKLEALPLKLEGFHVGDVVDWMHEVVPGDHAAICFPPFFSGDYEAMFRGLDKVFEWDAPTYPEMTAERRASLLQGITQKRFWLYGTHEAQPDLNTYLRGRVVTTNRSVPIYVYSSDGPVRIATPQQNLELANIPRLGPNDEIGNTLALLPIKQAQFKAVRSQYMNHNIRPGSAAAAYAVLADGKLVGAFALSFDVKGNPLNINLPRPYVYMLSDFPVNTSRYKRLAKLVLYAALSQESKLLIERAGNRRYRSILTTGFSKKPVSMKYRGLFELVERKELPGDPLYRYRMQYAQALGLWTLTEGLEQWKRKHGHHHT